MHWRSRILHGETCGRAKGFTGGAWLLPFLRNALAKPSVNHFRDSISLTGTAAEPSRVMGRCGSPVAAAYRLARWREAGPEVGE